MDETRHHLSIVIRRMDQLSSSTSSHLEAEDFSDREFVNTKRNPRSSSHTQISFTTRSAIRWSARAFIFYVLLSGLAFSLLGVVGDGVDTSVQPSFFRQILLWILFAYDNPFGQVFYWGCFIVFLPFATFIVFPVFLFVLLTAAKERSDLGRLIDDIKSGDLFLSMYGGSNSSRQ